MKWSILVNDFGKVKEVRDVQLEKALDLMDLTESGMDMEVRDEQPWKA